MIEAVVKVQPFSFRRTFALQNLGSFDPTATLEDARFRKTFAARNGPCTVTISPVDDGLLVRCEGADDEAVLQALLGAFAVDDGCLSFTTAHPLVGKLHREQPGLRLLRVPWLFDVACGAVLQQRVRFEDACRDWRHVAQRFGSRTPAGDGMFPSVQQMAAVPVFELEALGVDAKRARALVGLARELKLSPLRPEMSFHQMRGRLGRVAGVGPWTVETTLGFGAGDPDALPLGDLYLPGMVAYALAGEVNGTDERMIVLLEAFRGHRFRVVRLLHGARIAVPREARGRRSASV